MTKPEKDSILNYKISGKGPVIVLIHGYLSSLHYWDAVRATLEVNHTVITIDLLGFGSSPKPKSVRYDYDDQAQYIKQTLDHCHIQKPMLLVGHSMGALLSLHYASKYPESIQRLILMNTPFFKDVREARRELAGTNLFFRLSLYWELHRIICPLMRVTTMKLLMRQAMPQKYRGMEMYMFSSSAQARNRSLRNVIEDQHGIRDLDRLTMPVTLIQGMKERPTYIKNLLQIAKKPNLKIVLTDTGHHTVIDNPKLAIGELQA